MARMDAVLRAARSVADAADAELLLAHALGRSRSWLYAHGTDELEPDAATRFDALLQRRAAGEPVAYLTGQHGFWGLDVQVTPATLIPRPETELLVELALRRLATGRVVRIADLGTGSGVIALALASERGDAQVLATDNSQEALAVAAGNARALQLHNIRFCHGDWLAPLAGETFDLIASNPPYVADNDIHLQQGDLRFEPRDALASGADGLDALRTIVLAAPDHLLPSGWLLVEHGRDQGAAVRALFAEAGLHGVVTVRDLEQRERVTLGRRLD